jgi:hypothetical protein
VIVRNALRQQGLPPTDENIDMASEEVAQAWVEEQEGRYEEAQAEREYLQEDLVASEQAQSEMERIAEEGPVEPAEPARYEE